MFMVTSLCCAAVESAKKELWFEYQNPMMVCSQFLIRNTTAERLKEMKKSMTGRQRHLLSQSMRMLFRRWQHQGFNTEVQPENMYSQVLLCYYVTEQRQSENGLKKASFMDEFLRLKNVEAVLADELRKSSRRLTDDIAREVKESDVSGTFQNVLAGG